ncbi:DNA polymerase delta subunit 3 [Caerostris extrusa]|uniref:DNA polymerase delta subunit 3 n=1 Tax=Caerostris extrusa TaxID=172846 RepID=A0AAV4XKP0_CAEEX|nr:DNA polymerase delta subunit 3 [Caerostris extrusa]
MRAPILTKVNGLKKEMKVSIPKKESKSSFKIAAVNAVQKNEEEHPESNKSNQVAKPSVNGKSEAHAPIKKSNTETKTSKPNTLASMWQRSESKKNENSKPGGKSKSNSSLETKPAPKHSILSMLSKQAVMELSSKTEVICSKEDENNDNVSPPKIKEEIKSSKIQNKKKTSQTKVKSCKQKRNDSDDDCQPRKKKHRRICTFDDSDSESESEEAKDKALRDLCRRALDDDDSEEPIPPTPPVGKGKKKMWKSLPKTYKDEEGFLVTKQEKVLVSEDDEDPLPNEKSKDKETVNKSNQFTYRKQASLTSFFKQK